MARVNHREFIEAARSTAIDEKDSTAAAISQALFAYHEKLTGSRIDEVLSNSLDCDPDTPLGRGTILQVIAQVDQGLEGQLHALPYELRREMQLVLDFNPDKQRMLPFSNRREDENGADAPPPTSQPLHDEEVAA